MIMFSSTHRRLMLKAIMQIDQLKAEVGRLKAEVNSLIRMSALYSRHREVSSQFTPEQLRKMVQLCHPDKHNGSKLSVEVTQLLNAARK